MKSLKFIVLLLIAAIISSYPFAAAKDSEVHLTDVGMFYVGGGIDDDASYHTGQALVHYFASNADSKTPVVLYPGLGLTSYIYISTPDGRAGWAQQFAKAGHTAYVYDPVNTGPSGIPTDASITTWNANQIWPRWGFGDARDEPYENVRFPVEHMDQFYASWAARAGGGGMGGGAGGGMGGGGGMGMGAAAAPAVTDEQVQAAAARGRAAAGPDVAALIALLEKTGPAVLIPHSMGGTTVFQVANERPDLVAGIVVIEPVGCPRSAEQVAAWADRPFLGVYGDYVDSRGQTGRRDACRETAKLVNEAGGAGAMLELTEEGVFGNTHLLMQDDNSEDIAARIIAWIDENVD